MQQPFKGKKEFEDGKRKAWKNLRYKQNACASGEEMFGVEVRKQFKMNLSDHLGFDTEKVYTFTDEKFGENSMKNISLKLDDLIFGETEKILSKIKKPRNRYINEAVAFYNKHHKRVLLEKKLKKESAAVRASSMDVLKDFDEMEYGRD